LPHTAEAAPIVGTAAAKVGFETPVTWGGAASREQVLRRKQGLFNAARRAGVSLSIDDITKSGTEWKITFRLHDKRIGRAYVVTRHGSDRTQWPYNARAKG